MLYAQLFQPVLRAGGRLRGILQFGRCRGTFGSGPESGRWRDGNSGGKRAGNGFLVSAGLGGQLLAATGSGLYDRRGILRCNKRYDLFIYALMPQLFLPSVGFKQHLRDRVECPSGSDFFCPGDN